jgi:SMODS and SLOG-associating 2TM effector domain 1
VTTREQQFVDMYRRARVDDQRGYYEATAARFEAAYRQLLLGSAVLFGITGTVAILSGIEVPGKLVWATLAAVLPAVTTAIAAYEGLFAFQRIAKLYRDAARNLRRIQPPVLEEAATAQAALDAYVAGVERVLERERSQWGQLGAEPQAPSSGGDDR